MHTRCFQTALKLSKRKNTFRQVWRAHNRPGNVIQSFVYLVAFAVANNMSNFFSLTGRNRGCGWRSGTSAKRRVPFRWWRR